MISDRIINVSGFDTLKYLLKIETLTLNLEPYQKREGNLKKKIISIIRSLILKETSLVMKFIPKTV